MSTEIKFSDAPESKQYKSLDQAGVHRKFYLVEVEFQPLAPKMKKEKQDGKEVEVPDGDKTVGPWAKFVFRSEEPAQQFVTTMFSPPTKETDVKFFGDVYEKGVAIRKKTAQEQINSEFMNKFYFYEQLAKALQIAPDKFASFKNGVKGSPDVLFKEMFDKFFALFPLDKLKTKAIDIKTIWNNNIKSKTSFLQLAYPSASNLVFAPYIENRDSFLSVTASEAKLIKRMFSMHDRAPSTDATEAGGSGGGENSYKAVEVPGLDPDEKLF